jgi:hypothetical protein
MERHQTHLLKIYSETNSLALSKRKLLKSLSLPDLPPSPLQQEQRTSSTKLYLCISKFIHQLKRVLDEFGNDHHQTTIDQITHIAQGLKYASNHPETIGSCTPRNRPRLQKLGRLGTAGSR